MGVGLSVLFLAVLAALLQRVSTLSPEDPGVGPGLREVSILGGVLACLWLLSLAEWLIQWRTPSGDTGGVGGRKLRWTTLLPGLLPPLRLAARVPAAGDRVWLPVLGWQEVNGELRDRLERLLSVPMIAIALLILPVLGVEYVWGHLALQNPRLALALDLCTGVIWFAFTLEFIIMCSLAENRLAYCRQHWLDLAIILLPLISLLRFARVARVTQVLRVKQLSTVSRVYRLRGLSLRAYRALILLDLLDRLLHPTPEKRLAHLRAALAAKEAEVAELRRKIAELE